MALRLVVVAAVAALVALVAGLWWNGELRQAPPEARRELSHYRIERRPALPDPWWEALEERLAAAPAVSLLDPQVEAIATELFADVAWVDPASVVVQQRLPEGFRVLFRPRQPDLLLVRGGQVLAAIDADGTLLPPGLPEASLAEILAVPVDERFVLPAPGRRVADPLVHEALAAASEAYALRRQFGLQITRIERQPGYPADATNVPPALCFELANGASIWWGRSAATGATLTPSRAEKEARLASVLAQYPGLQGVATLVLDRDPQQALDAGGQPLPEGGSGP